MWIFWHKRASKSKVNKPIWLELIQDFMHVHIIKSHKDLIKIKKAMLRKRSNMGFSGIQVQVTLK